MEISREFQIFLSFHESEIYRKKKNVKIIHFDSSFPFVIIYLQGFLSDDINVEDTSRDKDAFSECNILLLRITIIEIAKGNELVSHYTYRKDAVWGKNVILLQNNYFLLMQK